ncbi:hypothetical protein [Neisseria zoodegmatis]|uniref:Uncharacterized protein n=1 Tax=Neisseria zoodegmatis TaxID=326523 RepID=A0AB38DRE1_9NEIS|nr:hypothetical protein [Neisseria zoodegmatis]OSI10578.1 hypothetical protein BWD10_03700 [Neisseria zoodegmatis]SNU79538.1 Uncharacterised protein [Neisseria zoodegmatis]
MGFINDKLKAEKDQYILLEDIILFVQSLDEETPSLANTAKYLLQGYKRVYLDDINAYGDIDEFAFEKTISDEYIQVDIERPFYNFLKFVAIYNAFDSGSTEDNPNWVSYNDYQKYFLKKDIVTKHLKSYFNIPLCGDIDEFIRTKEENDRILSKEEAKEALEELKSILDDKNEIKNLREQNKILKKQLKVLLDRIKKLSETQKQVLSEDLEIIQKHRKSAPEFEALIQTLLHHAHEYKYETGEQPLKKSVSITFQEKANLSGSSRRPDEAARILGLPE